MTDRLYHREPWIVKASRTGIVILLLVVAVIVGMIMFGEQPDIPQTAEKKEPLADQALVLRRSQIDRQSEIASQDAVANPITSSRHDDVAAQPSMSPELVAVNSPNSTQAPWSSPFSVGEPVATEAPAAKPPPIRNLRITPEPQGTNDKQPEQRFHRLVDGDTLENIAQRYFGSPQRSAEIFEANRNVLARPDVLPLGIRLLIPEEEAAALPAAADQTVPQFADERPPIPTTTLVPPMIPLQTETRLVPVP